MLLLYNLIVRCYYAAVLLASLWNAKARAWISGRRHVFPLLERSISPDDRVIWFHCSSAGEMEQAKPVIEALKSRYPRHRVVVSFFSPSGFEAARNYNAADLIIYMPLDTAANARRFMDLVHPELVVFVKYEFWYHLLAAAAFRHIPILLISASFRKEQAFFKRWGRFYRTMLFQFRQIFVQEQSSLDLLVHSGIHHGRIGGDTRFDRVSALAKNFTPLPALGLFCANEPVLVAGSTWPADERLLAHLSGIRMIIAPHELNESGISELMEMFPGARRYTQWNQQSNDFRVLILDTVGMLSRAYHYGTIAYVGGGFTADGVHNLLEPAVYGKPIVVGPNYSKYREARDLVTNGAAFSVDKGDALQLLVKRFLADEHFRLEAGERALQYVNENTGATERCLAYIQENRLLTSS